MSAQSSVTTVAGGYSGCTFRDGAGDDAAFRYPLSVCCRGDEVLVGDRHNHRVRVVRMEATGVGVVRTLAGSGDDAQLNRPSGVAVDPRDGSVLVADCWNHMVKRVSAEGEIAVVAGTGTKGFADGPALSAQFRFPMAVAVNRHGDILVADQHNHAIRKITRGGVVSTLAGTGHEGYEDGPPRSAKFHWPSGLAYDAADGSLYVADTANHVVRRVSEQGVVTTYAGSGRKGHRDAVGRAAQFNEPRDVALTAAREVVVADEGGHYVRRISPMRAVTTLAGTGAKGYSDGTGATAVLSGPSGVSIDKYGAVVFADCWNSVIRRIEEPGLGQNVRLMADPTSVLPVVLAACKAVRRCVDTSEGTRDVRRRLLHMDAVGSLTAALDRFRDDADLVSHCLAVLNVLSFSAEAVASIATEPVVQAVLAAARAHLVSESVQRLWCSVLWNVAASSPEARAVVVAAGAHSALVLSLQTQYKAKAVVEKASGLLFHLSKLPDCIAEFSDSSCLDVLVKALVKHATASAVVVQNLLAVFWNIAKGDAKVFVDHGLLTRILSLGSAATADALALQKLCGLLFVLLDCEECSAAVCEEVCGSGVLDAVMPALLEHAHDRVAVLLCGRVFGAITQCGQTRALFSVPLMLEAAVASAEQHVDSEAAQKIVWQLVANISQDSDTARAAVRLRLGELGLSDRFAAALRAAVERHKDALAAIPAAELLQLATPA